MANVLHINGLVKGRQNPIANALDLHLSWTNPLIWTTEWKKKIMALWLPASIATLAQRWPNVNPYVGPTSAHQRWANVDLSIGPTLAQRSRANVGPTLYQHRPNVGALTLGQRWHNVTPLVVCQRCTNIGPTEAALLAFCEGNPSITDGFPSQRTRNAGVDVCLNNRLNKQSSWVTGDLRHQCDRRQCNIHMSKDVTVLFRRCTDWSKHNVQKNNGLSLAGAKPLSEPTLVYIVNWTLANSENLIEIHIFAFKKMHLKMSSGKMAFILSGPHWVNMNQVFMLVYSRSVIMPGLDQNCSLLPALGRFRRKVVLANYGVKKLQRNMCWADVWSISAVRCRPNVASTLGWCRPPTSAQHRLDVSHNTWIL